MTNDPRATRAGRLAVSRRRREASLPAANWPRRYGSREPAAGPAAPPAGHDTVPPGSVPVSAIILARDEQVNIDRAVRSAGWCEQVVVVDSGSTDATRQIARAAGAEVWEQPWRGFAAQREWAMRAPGIRHDWVFFLDADEWVPVDLAAEIAARLGTEEAAGYTQRRRLVFLGRWIAHCGWYSNSWQARLLDRRRASFADAEEYGERASVDGPVRRLAADLVDEDGKGLADWLRKHVRYAELEAARRLAVAAAGAGDGPPPGPLRGALAAARAAVRERARSTRPLTRTLAKEVVLPLLPARPLAIFVYMYALRQGWRDGRAGLAFCLYHAWYALTVEQLVRSMRVAGAGAAQVAAGGQAAAAPAPGGQAPVVAGLPTQREPADARIEPGRAQAGGDARATAVPARAAAAGR